MSRRAAIEGWAGSQRLLGHRLPRRTLAALLLPLSLVPVVVLSPTLAKAPATLWRRTERLLLPPHAKIHHAPPPMQRYPIGAARLEVDVFEPLAGALTPQVGVSPLAEHAWGVRGAYEPVVLIVRAQEGGES
jgi:hypothetical protein